MERAQKQKLLSVARAMGILPLLEAARYLRCRYESAGANRRFLEENPNFSPPPLWWMHDMYRSTAYELYWRTGRETARVIAEKIDSFVDAPVPRVADWGCGLARVIRHLPDRYEKTGFDYNAKAIAWNCENIPGIRFHVNTLKPPLPVEAASFDALYALSVFTHLSAQGHEQWIAEIERVLAPNGIFLGAFHMRPLPGQLLRDEQARFDAGELVVRGGVKEGSRTYTAHHPESYLRERLLRNFDICEEPVELFGQTLFAARKR